MDERGNRGRHVVVECVLHHLIQALEGGDLQRRQTRDRMRQQGTGTEVEQADARISVAALGSEMQRSDAVIVGLIDERKKRSELTTGADLLQEREVAVLCRSVDQRFLDGCRRPRERVSERASK